MLRHSRHHDLLLPPAPGIVPVTFPVAGLSGGLAFESFSERFPGGFGFAFAAFIGL